VLLEYVREEGYIAREGRTVVSTVRRKLSRMKQAEIVDCVQIK
jgi:hypothetical protein